MGNVSGSTFYMFLGVLVIYLIGVSIYTLVQKIKKKRKMRERIKKIIIDYQKNKKRNYRFGDTLSIVK